MNVGTGILWSTALVLFVFVLYQISVRARWKAIFAVLILMGVVIGGGYWGWMTYQAWPFAAEELAGIRLGMTPVEITLLRGEPSTEGRAQKRSSENGERWHQDWQYTGDYRPIVRIGYRSPVGGAVSDLSVLGVCESGTYSNSKLFGIGTGTPEEEVIEHLGQPDSESIDKKGLFKIMNFKEWNANFKFERGRVIELCVSPSALAFNEEYEE